MALLDIPPDRRAEGGGEVGMTREEMLNALKQAQGFIGDRAK